MLVLLAAILAIVRLDRIALGLILESIKLDLQLSDMQLGLLSGLAFTLFYAVVGVPIARWADRGNRVLIIWSTTALWAVAVCLCGTATSFAQLLVIRVGVAIGEAGGNPASLSLLSDYFDRDDRVRAVGRYMLGLPIAVVVGNFATGWLNQLYDWRAIFLVVGVPGLLMAVIAAFTLKEPRRAVRSSVLATNAARHPSFKQVFRSLWSCAAYRHLVSCISIWGFFAFGILQWQPVFFIRSFAMTSGELGAWLALVYGLGGFLGIYLGGEMAARLAAGNERKQLIAIAVVYAMLAVLTAGVYVSSDRRAAFTLLALSAIGGGAANGPLFAAIQTLVPAHMRATATALMYLFSNLVGMGLGPLAAGALSDWLRPTFGDESLRYALLALAPGYLWCAWHIWRASRTFAQDSSAVAADERVRRAT